MVGVLLVGVVLGAVWQTYRDEQTRNLIKDWRHSSMSWLSYSFSATQRDSESSAQSSTKLSDQAAQRPTGASVQADEVADLKQQLLAVVNDLAIMRRDVEQISSKHEQLSRDTAAVQATEQNVSEKISSLTQPAPTLTQPARGQPRKKRPEGCPRGVSKATRRSICPAQDPTDWNGIAHRAAASSPSASANRC